jgi:hypothetical protein
MSASQQCHARGYPRARYLVVLALSSGVAMAHAGDDPQPPPQPACHVAAMIAHVQEQIRLYGPKSQRHEYFGFIYRLEGRIASVVTRSSECKSADRCLTDTADAAKQIPKGARVLGEWHTHPVLNGSRSLSAEDVRGAHHNRQIRCYTPLYSTPGGDIFSWDANQTSVPTAMNSRVYVGNRDELSAVMTAESIVR